MPLLSLGGCLRTETGRLAVTREDSRRGGLTMEDFFVGLLGRASDLRDGLMCFLKRSRGGKEGGGWKEGGGRAAGV